MWQLKHNTGYSLFFEYNNSESYYRKRYDVYVDGELYIEASEVNTFSIYKTTCDSLNIMIKSDEVEYHQTVVLNDANYFLDVSDYLSSSELEIDVTIKLQALICSAPANTTMFFPSGNYKITTLFLKSDLKLVFAEGVTFIVSTSREQFPVLPGVVEDKVFTKEACLTSWEGNPLSSHASILNGFNLNNVALIGPLKIEANSNYTNWWKNPKQLKKAWRPKTIFLNSCTNVTIHGLQIYNSPSWSVHPFYCNDVTLIDMYINNTSDSPNTDGINPESCQDVEINGCLFDLGDDCIAIKSGKLHMASNYFKPARRITISNCMMLKGHGAIVIGSEISCGVKDVYVKNCVFHKTDRGLRIKTRRGRGNQSIVDQVVFENIIMKGVQAPITMNAFYCCDPDGHSDYVSSFEQVPVDDFTPVLGNFKFNNLRCTDITQVACIAYGLPEQKIDTITICGSRFSFAEDKLEGEPIMLKTKVVRNNQLFELRNVSKFTANNNQIDKTVKANSMYMNVDQIKEECNEYS